jgi:GGDEF domain-containing protein
MTPSVNSYDTASESISLSVQVKPNPESLPVNIVYFIDESSSHPSPADLPGVTLHCYPDHNAYFASMLPARAFVIALSDPQQAAHVLLALRGNPLTALQPIFTTAALAMPLESVCDGRVNSLQQALALSYKITEKLQELDSSALTSDRSGALLTLGYLFTRPEQALTPYRNWSNEHFYSYPIVEAILGTNQGIYLRLSSMRDRKLLGHGELVDRLRHCPDCDGVHLNYVDVCPSCKSIAILKKPFLHCFTCGKVEPEERFLEHGTLLCPNCKTRLRHIGSDYDSPLENFECQACHHLFIEPEVLARCMHCNSFSEPDKLIPRSVFSYELTDQGALTTRSGMLQDLFAVLDTVNHVSPTYFMNLVNWLMNLARRHTEERFTIIGIRLKNVLELNARLGRHAVAELMDTLAKRLRELIRSTDLTTRTGQQMLWIMLAKTGRPQHQIVLKRILDLKKLLHPVEGMGLDFETVEFCAPDDLNPSETGKLLLARLEGGFE